MDQIRHLKSPKVKFEEKSTSQLVNAEWGKEDRVAIEETKRMLQLKLPIAPRTSAKRHWKNKKKYPSK